jgi:hypothetical protein
LELPLRIFFEKPILEELAEHIELVSWVTLDSQSFPEGELEGYYKAGTI